MIPSPTPASGGIVHDLFKGVINAVVKYLHLEPKINSTDIVMEFYGPSRWKELSKESGSKILPCGDGSCWKAFKPIASLIASAFELVRADAIVNIVTPSLGEGSYRPQCLDAYSYRATCIEDSIPRKEKDPESLRELAHTKLTDELADRTGKHPKGIAKNVLVWIGKFIFPVDFIILDMPENVKVPLILERPFLSTSHAKIHVFKRKITLGVGDEKIIFKSVKPASSLIRRVYMLSLRELMELDLEARLLGETLILDRSLDPLYGDYIKLNDLNVPLELRRDQVDDLIPVIEEGKVVDKPMIEEVKTRNDNKMVSKIIRYPSDYEQDEKIRIDYAYNMKFSCMIGFKFVHANFFPNLPINVMSKKFYNSIMNDKIKFRGRNELGNFANVPVFIGNFYVITDFTVVKDIDPYLDEGIGEVVAVEPFVKFHV
nr:reverse transcriptase domain-containing protein [Tanacetum cinerariifolium]